MKDILNNIMNIMETIEYGFKENNINILYNNSYRWNNEFNDFYYLQTPKELLKSKCGVCWDQVELERYLFEKEKIKCNSYFIYIKDGDNLPSHTFLTFNYNNKYYWFEHSWYKYKGIHEYNSITELLHDVIQKFLKEYKVNNSKNQFYLYEYSKPKIHIKCNEFYKFIEECNRVYIDNQIDY